MLVKHEYKCNSARIHESLNKKYTIENSILFSNDNPYTDMIFYKDYITACTIAWIVPYDS